MPSIQTGIQLQDNFSAPMRAIVGSASAAVPVMQTLQGVLNSPVSATAYDGAVSNMQEATAAAEELNSAVNKINNNKASKVSTVQIDAGPMQKQIADLTGRLNTLSQAQSRINNIGKNLYVLPDGVSKDISQVNSEITRMQKAIDYLNKNPFNLDADTAELQIRSLSSAIDSVSAKQQNLNRIFNNAPNGIQKADAEQRRFNNSLQQGTTHASGLMDMLKRAVSVYAILRGAGSAINMSDSITQTTARLDLMNDGLQSTQDLVDMTYAAAQDARGTFTDMAGVVARFGNNAKDAFSSNQEVIAFSNLVQKQMNIAGASTQEASAAMLQLSQAMGSGVLRGDELNSVFEQAPNLIQNIADYLNVPIGKIREMAQEGQLSASTVKAAVFAASDEINANFEKMPMTFGQMWAAFKNDATMAFQPVLKQMNELGNSSGFQEFVSASVSGVAKVASVTLSVFNLAISGANLVKNNWYAIGPAVGAVVTAMLLYKGTMLAINAATAIHAGLTAISTAASAMKTGATLADAAATEVATGAQVGYNTALLACPVTWLILEIVLLTAAVIAFAGYIAKSGGTATTTFGVICGWVGVAKAAVVNFGLSCANTFLGVGNAGAALCSNIKTAFGNAIKSVQSMWYELLSTALTVIGDIANGLNALPFINIDYEGISAKASQYAAKSYEANKSKKGYKSLSDAFDEGYSTFDTYQDNWWLDAYDKGAQSGDKKAKAFKAKFSLNTGKASKAETLDMSKIAKSAKKAATGKTTNADKANSAKTASNTGKIADNTAKIAANTTVSKEDLKYMRDMVETKIINRTTTVQNKFDIVNNNTVNNEMDLDGVSSGLCDQIKTKIDIAMEGVR